MVSRGDTNDDMIDQQCNLAYASKHDTNDTIMHVTLLNTINDVLLWRFEVV